MDVTIEQRLGFIFGRRSIRVYKPGEVSDAAVHKMLEAAMAAPSAVAADPWRFVVVRSRQMLRRMADRLPHGQMLPEAAVGIVVCGDLEAAHDRQLSYLLQDCSAAIENLLLCAHAIGFGACWLGVHPREQRVTALKELFHLPAPVIPVACVAIGVPGEHKDARTRFREEFVHQETW